jgi:sodium-dependent dicarboxylate transporter 2/3/5
MNESENNIPSQYRWIGVVVGILSYIFIGYFNIFGLEANQSFTLSIAALMICWWITESVPMPVVALLPVILFPMHGLLKMEEVLHPYSNSVVFLFMGGFFLGLAMEKSNLHRRIALTIIQFTGTRPNTIILGFMLSTAFISMWISNTATSIMMLPIAGSVITLFEQKYKGNGNLNYFSLVMMLSIAYASNIGGISTLIGTPPNVVMSAYLKETFQYEVSFLQWMMVCTPLALCLLLVMYILLVYVIYPNRIKDTQMSSDIIKHELSALGPMNRNEKLVLVIFFFTVFRWVFRSVLDQWIPAVSMDDTGIAIFSSVLLFLIPAGNIREYKTVLTWNDTKKLPWGILLLFGGGLSLANAMEKAGIMHEIGQWIHAYSSVHLFVFILLITLVAVFISEFMSNVALVMVFVPVVGTMAKAMQINPLLFTIPLTLGASCAFMLPMGTPPNALVFSTGKIKVAQMAKSGLLLNLISAVMISIFSYFFIELVFN